MKFSLLGYRIASIFSALLISVSKPCEIAHATSGGSTFTNIAGLYLYMTQVSGPNKNWNDMYDDALPQRYVDGAAIMLEWNKIEPQPDVYDWSSLDRWVVKTVKLNKKLSIGVIAGAWTPGWLYRSGVADNIFNNYDRGSPSKICSTIHQPSVWDTAYLGAYSNIISQLSKHLHELQIAGQPRGAAYAALRVVKLSGINLTTEELRINAHPPGGPCNESNSAAIWAQAGYRPQKIKEAWMFIAKSTEEVFPDKVLSVAIIHRGGFPPIDDSGNIDTAAVTMPTVPDPMLVEILNTAVPTYRDRLMVQWNALSQFTGPGGHAVLPQEVLAAGARGARVGWQLNGFLGVWGGSGCIYLPFRIMPCKTIEDFEAILNNGIDHGAEYIEIHPVTVSGHYLKLPADAIRNYAPAFQRAHDRLKVETR